MNVNLERVAAVRRFNRLCTPQIDWKRKALGQSPVALDTNLRVLHVLA